MLGSPAASAAYTTPGTGAIAIPGSMVAGINRKAHRIIADAVRFPVGSITGIASNAKRLAWLVDTGADQLAVDELRLPEAR